MAVYALADYVLRGEAYPCVGRTIYEALYAGCGVIIPGSPANHTLFEYERFAPRVHFYPPADEARLRAVFEALQTVKLADKRGESNVAAHVAAFDAIGIARFPLARYREAIHTARHAGRAGVMKTAFVP